MPDPTNGKTNLRKWLLAVVALILVALLGTGIGIHLYREHKLYYHFDTVDPGKLYRSGILTYEGMRRVKEDTGIRTVVNLIARGELKDDSWYDREKEIVDKLGLEFVDIPMGSGCPPQPEQVRQFLRIATDPDKQPVLVHCEQGVVRTGMMVSVYEVMELKRDPDQVYDTLPMFGHDLGKYPAVVDFIRTLPESPDALPEPKAAKKRKKKRTVEPEPVKSD
jgi:Uncharacterized protein conserved in bacteria